MTTRKLVYTAMFAALIAAGAFMKIPTPICPITFQVFFVTLAGLLLGAKLGSFSVICYIFIGLIGLPVFTAGGGIGYIFQPTFGYLIGFIFGAYAAGKIANAVAEPKIPRLIIACMVAIIIIYVIGTAYYWMIRTFYTKDGIGFSTLMLYCFLMPLPGDVIMSIVASIMGKRIIPHIKKSDNR